MSKHIFSTFGSVGSVVLYAMIPKCPLCVAAALSAFGISASISASMAPLARSFLFILAALVLATSAFTFWRSRSSRACAARCRSLSRP